MTREWASVNGVLSLTIACGAARGSGARMPDRLHRARGVALGLLMAAAALGGVVHPQAAEALIRTAGWRAAHLALGGLGSWP
ncbi:MAG TPA: hypothetical protein VFM88_14095 [Vicinamibacteria bacterium]|nr:hypothetical protein [Vicinamibacteria bacterium]